MKTLQVYSMHSDIFGTRVSKNEIIKHIDGMNIYPLCVILSKLSYKVQISNDYEKEFVQSLKDFYPQYDFAKRAHTLLNEGTVLFGPQGIECLWKWLLKYYSVFDTEVNESLNLLLARTIEFILIVQDQLNEGFDGAEESVLNELLRNSLFNYTHNDNSHLVRSFYMFLDETVQESLADTKEYVDIKLQFHNHYGFSIKEFFIVMVALYMHFTLENSDLDKPWILNVEDYFAGTGVQHVAPEIVALLTIKDDIEEWLNKSIEKDWDVEYFFKNPLFAVGDNKVIPISKNRMLDQLHNALFFRIQESFQNKSDFNTFMGRAFENYVCWVAKECLNGSSRKKYELIEEFHFKKGQFKSPDLMIMLGKKVIVIEAKLRRIAYEGLGKGDDEVLRKSHHDIYVRPTMQAIKCIQRMIEFKIDNRLNEDCEFYFMTVTPDAFPVFEILEKEHDELRSNSPLNIKSINCVDIEEYEYLMEYMFRDNSKSIFKFFDRVSSSNDQISIRNHMISSHMRPRSPEIIRKYARNVYDILEEELICR